MQIATSIDKLQVYKRLMTSALIHIQFLRVYPLVLKTAKILNSDVNMNA